LSLSKSRESDDRGLDKLDHRGPQGTTGVSTSSTTGYR
jgi:hypothetical protein